MNTFYLDEVYGIGNIYDYPSPNAYDANIPPFTRHGFDLIDPEVNKAPPDPPPPRLQTWQIFFKDRIIAKQDTFMIVPPGAGKTSPILQAYGEQFLSAHGIGGTQIDKKSKEFPRLLYIGRTKQLSGEAFSQNIRGDKSNGLIRMVTDHPREFGLNPSINQQNRILTRDDTDKIYDIINQDLLGISAGSIKTSPFSQNYKLKCVYISTPSPGQNSQLLRLIRDYGDYFNCIIIDESQDYMIKPNEAQQSKSDEEMFRMYIDIIRLARRPGLCGVQLLSGTTNMETANRLVDDLNKCYKRNFKIPTPTKNIQDPNDGQMFFSRDYNDIKDPRFAGNRSNIKVIPNDMMATVEQKKRLIIDIVNSDQKNSIMVIFSVRRDAKTGIFRLINDILPFLPPRSPVELYSRHEKEDQDETVPGVDMTVKYFRKQNQGEFVANTSYNPKSEPERKNKEIYDNQNRKVNLNKLNSIEFLKYFDIVKTESGSGDEMYSQYPNENNLMYQAALRGIGVMIGKSDNRHKEIMQKLFRDGKLTLLLATDKNCRVK
jgi:hypothetical protein